MLKSCSIIQSMYCFGKQNGVKYQIAFKIELLIRNMIVALQFASFKGFFKDSIYPNLGILISAFTKICLQTLGLLSARNYSEQRESHNLEKSNPAS